LEEQVIPIDSSVATLEVFELSPDWWLLVVLSSLPKCWSHEMLKRVTEFPPGLFLIVSTEMLTLPRRERSAVTPDFSPG
jgi:hypothetical protein